MISLIRTSGEVELIIFVVKLYAELYLLILWTILMNCSLNIADYQKRERRFGKTSEQITG